MKLKNILIKPLMCRKTLERGWVATKRDGKIIWVYEPTTASAIKANKHLLYSQVFREALNEEVQA